MLHAPVPITGVFADNVTVVDPQVKTPVWSIPASAIVGAMLINVTVEDTGLAPVHPTALV